MLLSIFDVCPLLAELTCPPNFNLNRLKTLRVTCHEASDFEEWPSIVCLKGLVELSLNCSDTRDYPNDDYHDFGDSIQPTIFNPKTLSKLCLTRINAKHVPALKH